MTTSVRCSSRAARSSRSLECGRDAMTILMFSGSSGERASQRSSPSLGAARSSSAISSRASSRMTILAPGSCSASTCAGPISARWARLSGSRRRGSSCAVPISMPLTDPPTSPIRCCTSSVAVCWNGDTCRSSILRPTTRPSTWTDSICCSITTESRSCAKISGWTRASWCPMDSRKAWTSPPVSAVRLSRRKKWRSRSGRDRAIPASRLVLPAPGSPVTSTYWPRSDSRARSILSVSHARST